MNRKTKAAIAVVSFLACSAARAEPLWISVGTSADEKQEHFIDMNTVKVAGSVRTVWIKTVYKPHSTTLGDPNKWVERDVSHLSFNCADQKMRYETVIAYYEDGTNNTEANSLPGWADVAPETIAAAEMEFVCSLKNPRRN